MAIPSLFHLRFDVRPMALTLFLLVSSTTPTLADEAAVEAATSSADQASDEAEAAEDRERFGDEIIVFGQQIDRSLQETQTSVALITGDDLENDTQTDLFDIFERAANANVTQGGFGFAIRGISDTGVAGGGSGLLVDVNVDGASAVTSQGIRTGALSTWDLEQVEIHRGPQSTQQGRNALAGAVSVRSVDPGFSRELKARVDVGEYKESRLAAAVNVPLIENRLAFRLAYEDWHNDGAWINPTLGTDDVGQSELETLRAKLRFVPSDAVDIVLAHSVTDNRLGNNHVALSEWPDRRVNFSNEENREAGTSTSTNLRIEVRLDERWTLRSETTIYENDYRTEQDADFTAADLGSGFRDIIDETTSQDLRFGYTGERLRGTIGLFYTDIETDLDFLARVPGFFFGLPGIVEIGNNQDTKVTNGAVYGELDVDLSPRLTLTAGLRFDSEEREDVLSSNFLGNVSPPSRSETDYSALLPKLGLVYRWSERISTAFTIQQGYRSGGSGLTFGTGEPFEFDEELTTNYEVSLRSEHQGGRVVANANVFFTEWEDQQVVVEGPSGTFFDSITTNAGESELAGAELEVSFRPTDQFDGYFSLGYVETEFKEFVTGGEDLAGNAFPYAPNWTAAIGGTLTFGGGFEAQINASFTDEAEHSAQNLPEEVADSYVLVDARFGYRWPDWSAFVYARNLLDEDYLSRRRIDGFNNAGEPRTVGVTLSYRFF